MLSPITVQRASVACGLLDPVQLSANHQLAVNNSGHLTIIEPKLPSLLQCLSSVSSSSNGFSLNSAAIYDVRSIFHIENLESLGFQIFSRILIQDQQRLFNFGRITEPLIVAHAWSPLDFATRDCYLAVLLNTGEVFVLKRESLDANNYSVKFRSFTCLLDQMALPSDRLTGEGDIILTGDQFSELKVTAFSFGIDSNGASLMCLAHESNSISVHLLVDKMPCLSSIPTSGLVVKLLWASATQELYYLLSDNSVWGCSFDTSTGILQDPVLLKNASRFNVSQLNFISSFSALIVADTKSLHVGSLGSKWITADLPSHAMLTGLPLIETPASVDGKSSVKVLLPFETGRLCVAVIEDSPRSICFIRELPGWDRFFLQTMSKFSNSLTKEQNKAPSKAFQPYLSDSCEGIMTLCGISPILSAGLLAIVFTLSPKNVINHVIKSRQEYNVAFMPISSLFSDFVQKFPIGISSLSCLNALIVSDIAQIPKITKQVRDGVEEAVSEYLNKLLSWKREKMPSPDSISLTLVSHNSLAESIRSNFRENVEVDLLQKIFLLNDCICHSLKMLKSSVESSNQMIDAEVMKVAEEQDLISSKIRIHFGTILLRWASAQDEAFFSSAFDRFILSSHSIVLAQTCPEIDFTLSLPADDSVTISSNLCTETFNISKDRKVDANFLKFVESSSRHSWRRCDMTFLPILDLSNKTDEMERLSYFSSTLHDSYILDVLSSNLNYCIFTGTRTFELKIGV